jgi:hypothetical protein
VAHMGLLEQFRRLPVGKAVRPHPFLHVPARPFPVPGPGGYCPALAARAAVRRDSGIFMHGLCHMALARQNSGAEAVRGCRLFRYVHKAGNRTSGSYIIVLFQRPSGSASRFRLGWWERCRTAGFRKGIVASSVKFFQNTH